MDLLSNTFEYTPDTRQANRVDYNLHDTLMSGVAMLFLQHAKSVGMSAHDETTPGRCNLETICRVHEVPSDIQMREILDEVPPELLRHVLPELFAKVRRVGWGKEFTSTIPSGWHQSDDYIAMLEGHDYFHSTKGQCPSC
jgi:hypothetical protein